MTRVQELEFRRLTPLMKELLQVAAKSRGIVCAGQDIRSARILERRGFLVARCDGNGPYVLTLTPAGTEALARLGPNVEYGDAQSPLQGVSRDDT
jgi:hypothetical protein